MARHAKWVVGAAVALVTGILSPLAFDGSAAETKDRGAQDPVSRSALQLVNMGRDIFRFDTFGDEAFWGGVLKLHQAVEGAANGGVGPGVSPKTALAVGLKVDIDALPPQVLQGIKHGTVNLDDPASTLALLKANAVVGLTGFFNASGNLQSIGIQCALCHSTVDNSQPGLCAGAITPNPGTGCIGHRMDGWANRDLNVGAIVALSPDLSAVVNLLKVVNPAITQDDVRAVLNSWGPGKFDAELFLDGKAFNTQQVTDGVATATPVSAATLIPPAFGLGGVNLHTWTGWGSVPHWNAFVATLEMHGKGRFWDPRLDNAGQFPIAAAFGFGDLPHISPDDDRITPKLQALQFYQLALPSPQPPAGSFDAAAAERGDALFSGKAKCNNCHVEPLWTDPGWNLHTPAEVCIDAFQANRAPDLRYRTSPIGVLFTRFKGGFYHDGRFPTLDAVVSHYDKCMTLGLTAQEKSDLVQYLLSLTFGSQSAAAQRDMRRMGTS
ncbi:MAG TPA: hypothetical protein VFP44_20035 [Usitatibacter sp.]|nr:hypothetical protein [Usitatibacter sp.]